MELEDGRPQYMTRNSQYNLLNNRDFVNESLISADLLMHQSIVEAPGGWIYRSYVKHKINILRFLHAVGYIIEVVCYFISESRTKFREKVHNDTFALDPLFVSICWGIIVILGGAFLYCIFRNDVFAITMLAEQLRYIQLPFYILISLYLMSKHFFSDKDAYVINDCCLIVLMILCFYLYFKVKYKDDGRYIVSWASFFGVHGMFSILSAWILVELFHNAILTADTLEDKHNFNILGWKSEYWTITLMSIEFGFAVLMLSTLKDVFFAFTMGYSFFGIYSLQARKICLEECSNSVKTTALALGIVIICFTFLTVLLYSKQVCFSMRKNF
jgi:hypothetical protein